MAPAFLGGGGVVSVEFLVLLLNVVFVYFLYRVYTAFRRRG
ncbi:hypothetical protein [Haloarchaeobius sp. DFWS5]